MHVVMRSQSALMLLPYDMFLMSMLHELAAVELGWGLGRLIVTCSSLHIYEDEMARAERFLSEDGKCAFAMAPMPEGINEDLDGLVEAECQMRSAVVRGDDVVYDRLTPYSSMLLRALHDFLGAAHVVV